MSDRIDAAVAHLTGRLLSTQAADGAWRFCCESGVMSDAYMILILRTLELNDKETIRSLHDRIRSLQQENGAWKAYPDESEGNVSATAEACLGLLCSRYSKPSDAHVLKAKRFIQSRGGFGRVGSPLTKALLAVVGLYPWERAFPVPVEFLLLPPGSPVDFF